MNNEYYIVSEITSTMPMVQVYFENKQLMLPLVTYAMKEHAIINLQNKMRTGIIKSGQVQRLSSKGDIKLPREFNQAKLI